MDPVVVRVNYRRYVVLTAKLLELDLWLQTIKVVVFVRGYVVDKPLVNFSLLNLYVLVAFELFRRVGRWRVGKRGKAVWFGQMA